MIMGATIIFMIPPNTQRVGLKHKHNTTINIMDISVVILNIIYSANIISNITIMITKIKGKKISTNTCASMAISKLLRNLPVRR